MLSSIRNLLGLDSTAPSEEHGTEAVAGGYSSEARVALVALLHAMAGADFEVRDEETEQLQAAVESVLGVDRREASSLLDQGAERAAASVSLYEFTAVLHRQLSPEKKAETVELLWAVACADGEIDRQEEFLVRKVARLLHLPQEEFIAAKKRALAARG